MKRTPTQTQVMKAFDSFAMDGIKNGGRLPEYTYQPRMFANVAEAKAEFAKVHAFMAARVMRSHFS